MYIRRVLTELVVFYGTRRGIGHTTCALRGMGERVESATIKPMMVVATYEHGCTMAREVGRDNFITLGNIEAGKLMGSKRPLVWDNFAIAQLVTFAARELEKADQATADAVDQAAVLRRKLDVAEAALVEANATIEKQREELATLRAAAAQASFSKKRRKGA
jgi:hypothetical protein